MDLLSQLQELVATMSNQDLAIWIAASAGAVATLVVLLVLLRKRAAARRLERDLAVDVTPAPLLGEAPPPGEVAVDAAIAEPAVTPVAEPVAKPVVKALPKGRSYKDGLLKTRQHGFVSRLSRLLSTKRVDADMMAEIEEVLLTADIGVKTASRLAEGIEQALGRGELADAEKVWDFLRERCRAIFDGIDLSGAALHQSQSPDDPLVILVVGVNGSGKTTTIGKLAWRFHQEGKRIHLVAGDTFRAAAEDQLQIWAERAEASFSRGVEGADPSSVIFEGIREAREAKADIVLVDTAGRLHTKLNLIEELKKVSRVCSKVVPKAPHETYLVLDGTNGQNAIQQAITFKEAVDVSGIVMTKLDGTAKGGVVIGIADELGLPILYTGVGERPEDLRPFAPDEFVDAIFASDG